MERIPNDGCYARTEAGALKQKVAGYCQDNPPVLYSIMTTVSVLERDRNTREQKIVRKTSSYAFCLPCAKHREARLFI